MTGYNLTEKEVVWINDIQAKVRADLERRGFEYNEDYILTTSILAVTYFTRKLKLIEE